MSKNTKQIQHGIYLAYKPVYLTSGGFESFIVYLINNDKTSIDIDYEHIVNESKHFKVNTSIGAEQYYELGIISCEDCNESQLIIVNGAIGINKTISVSKKVQPKVFFRSFSNIPFLEKEGIIILIYRDKKELKKPDSTPVTIKDIDNIRAQLMGGNTKELKKSFSNASDVVDLHWENIKQKDPSIKNDNILEHQLSVLEKELDISIAEGKNSIIFIHGIGSGKLKNTIFAYLASHPFVESYNNDYDSRYGYGATKVLLKTK